MCICLRAPVTSNCPFILPGTTRCPIVDEVLLSFIHKWWVCVMKEKSPKDVMIRFIEASSFFFSIDHQICITHRKRERGKKKWQLIQHKYIQCHQTINLQTIHKWIHIHPHWGLVARIEVFSSLYADHRCHLELLLLLKRLTCVCALRDKSSSFIFINISNRTGI